MKNEYNVQGEQIDVLTLRLRRKAKFEKLATVKESSNQYNIFLGSNEEEEVD